MLVPSSAFDDISSGQAHYNDISLFDDQTHTTPSMVLDLLAKLFVRYQVYTTFGLSLLHRHYTLESSSIMVHSRSSDGTELCVVRKEDSVSVQPIQFRVSDQRKLTPFELTDVQSDNQYRL